MMIQFNKWLSATACLLSLVYAQTNEAMAQTTRAVTPDESAMRSAAVNDTIVIPLGGNGKLLLLGARFEDYKAYAAKADRTKTYLINDLEKAYSQKQIPARAQEVHYFLYNEQKRRVKAETPEYSEYNVDVAYEVKRLELDLPKYHYVVHDLAAGMEWEVYVNNPDSVMLQLSELGMQAAIETALANRKQYRKYVKIELGNNMRIANEPARSLDMIQVSPIIGVTLLGNVMTPALGGNLELGFSNKYGIQQHRVGLAVYGLTLLQTNNNEVTGIQLINAYDLRWLYNAYGHSQAEPFWVGLQVGILKSKDLKSYDNAFKMGFAYERRNIGWSFDFIKTKDSWDTKKAIYSVTVRLPF